MFPLVMASFSDRTVISILPNNPIDFHFVSSRAAGSERGMPVPHVSSKLDSTRFLFPVFRRAAINPGFWKNFALIPGKHSSSAALLHSLLLKLVMSRNFFAVHGVLAVNYSIPCHIILEELCFFNLYVLFSAMVVYPIKTEVTRMEVTERI